MILYHFTCARNYSSSTKSMTETISYYKALKRDREIKFLTSVGHRLLEIRRHSPYKQTPRTMSIFCHHLFYVIQFRKHMVCKRAERPHCAKFILRV
jgi:hypothetical protein